MCAEKPPGPREANQSRAGDQFQDGQRTRPHDSAIFAQSGTLCTYGPRLTGSYRRAAYYVDRILKGAKPADLPIERPTVFELVVNLKTAKSVRIILPQSLLLRADQVIQ